MFAKLKSTAALLCSALLAVHGAAPAQPMAPVGGFPNQAIKFVSPFPAGGGNDATTRFVTSRLPDITGQSAVVDNRGGAGGNIGAKAVADAKPDGYTVLTGQVSLMAVNPTLYTSPGFDPLKNFLPITQINAAPLVLVVASGSPFKNFADLAAQTKAPGSRVTYATPGNGTLSHLVGVVLEKDSAIGMTHVPYKGAAPAITDLLGGQVDVLITSTASVASFIQQGKMRALAVTSPRRIGVFTKVPTLEELGYRNTTFEDWYGFFAPAGTPPDRVAYLHASIVRSLKSPEVSKLITEGGSEVVGNTPAAFAAQLKEDIARWSRVVKLSGAKLD
ncbi:Tripartite-type tricarboxylate transporter, receptor component TctC [Polaromonas sp. YR568]|uniref:Bug family tripartite tricarboxylate transporter substrate binding protein n=1 Tax=Polaromonas sp. YR568 TaxID=1855301 RepID=UPI0008DF623D|nr:tripartite tricarboxylate transporter substrate binding protein [Polaromonas sp. YR568]SFU55513.1 Tripartite-type tricarboxylate transporter, receptor component TctC [Polaromonas sp. YR568]